MQLPSARGPVSARVVDALRTGARPEVGALSRDVTARASVAEVLTDDDLHAALWVLYELHFRGFDDVDEDREWDPDLLAVRASLEAVFEEALREVTRPRVEAALAGAGDVADRLFAMTEAESGPSLARFLQREATAEQLREFLVQRSAYHLKESDPQSFVLPRLDGAPKVALAELQYDEYGGGRTERLHATMFGDALEACGLSREYGAYLDETPGHVLAVNNAMSMFGLHRRLRGAALGHLGAFEATSSMPCRRIASGIRRLDLPEAVAAYFDEHVEADAVHEQVAFRDICAAVVAEQPRLLPDVLFGAATCLHLDAVSGGLLLDAWTNPRPGSWTMATEPVA
ncbi:MAG TPA: iron-containing redox enzyme family protein [Nocardioidaceae bacterium]|nr:iron-containing redox enzyme family protein [Nocardioidaceae bacterium]